MMIGLWTAFIGLTWWQMTLWVVYTVYFMIRAWHIWDETSDNGIVKGYRYVFFGYYGKEIRLYHIVRMLFDVPPALVGLLFPFFRKVLSLKVYTFKEEKKNEKQ